MDHTPIHSKTSIADLFKQFPQTIPVFINHRMGCVGCSMSEFEELGEVARIYNLPLEHFLTELRAAARLAGNDPA